MKTAVIILIVFLVSVIISAAAYVGWVNDEEDR